MFFIVILEGKMNKSRLTFFLLLAFLEGGTVMAAELIGAKMLAPFFGSSLYVWSSVMAVTLFGLAAGYFIGGILSEKQNAEKKLYIVLLFASLFLVLMPLTSKIVLYLLGLHSLLPAVIASSLLILFPPVFLMGMVSPLIVKNCSEQGMASGRAAGTVYAVSTVGGILSTFLFGFYIIPTFGLSIPAVVSGFILAVIPGFTLIKKKEYKQTWLLIVLAWMTFQTIAAHQEFSKGKSGIKIIYSNEGLLGQILVLDYPNEIYYSDSTRKGEFSRWLYVNRISQTMDNTYAKTENNEEQYFTYVYTISETLKEFSPDKKDILLLGLGGGSVAKTLVNDGHRVDACELDKRIAAVAINYFSLPQSVTIHIDDARHHLKTSKKKYDVFIFDTFKGEETPNHVLTKESLIEVKEKLNKDGLIFINSFGYFKGEKGRGMRCIYKTLVDAGFNTKIFPTHPNEDQRNLVFIASLSKIPERKEFLKITEEELKDAVVLSDEYPAFEFYNAKAGLQWRRLAIQNYYRDINQREIGIFD